MTPSEYIRRVIELFRRGKPTDQQYREMAVAVRQAAERCDGVPHIDKAIGVWEEER